MTRQAHLKARFTPIAAVCCALAACGGGSKELVDPYAVSREEAEARLDTANPTVSIVVPTSSSTYSTTAGRLSLGGSAIDDRKVARVTWVADRGGSGIATLSDSARSVTWTASELPLADGANSITVRVYDQSGKSSSRTLVVEKTDDPTAAPAPAPAPAPSPATVTLAGLPASPTTSTSASITHTLNGSGTVYCRRDGFEPAPCPNPFVLGLNEPLAAGTHRVDYYIDAGSGVSNSAPAASHTWEITATASAPAPAPAPAPSPAPAPTSALSPMPMPASLVVSGVKGSWDGLSTIKDASGNVLLAPAADPKGSDASVAIRRVMQTGSLIWGGVRAENSWQGSVPLSPGVDYWMAFAVMINTNEPIVANTTDDALLVFQTHSPAPGDTQPDVALFYRGITNKMFWRVAYNTYPSNTWQYVGGSNPDTQGTTTVASEELPAAGEWRRFIVHYRPGYLSSHNPLVEIWSAKPGQDYVKIASHTGFNTYNSLSGASYPRIGPYKWTGSAWNRPSQSFYQSPLHFGQGANLFEASKAALAKY